jgi:hypothetical protein
MSEIPYGAIHMAPGHLLRQDDAKQDYLLVHNEASVPLTSDQTRILSRCNGASTVEDIVQEMQRQTPPIEPDETRAFLKEAFTNNWINGQ